MPLLLTPTPHIHARFGRRLHRARHSIVSTWHVGIVFMAV
jgi:hypothetical protein